MPSGAERSDSEVVAENERLRGDVERLAEENDRLAGEVDQLTDEVDRLAGENVGLRSEIDSFARKIAALEKRLSKNSENSSLPPSSDLFGRKKDKPENANRAARRALGRKPGKQPGADGQPLCHRQPQLRCTDRVEAARVRAEDAVQAVVGVVALRAVRVFRRLSAPGRWQEGQVDRLRLEAGEQSRFEQPRMVGR